MIIPILWTKTRDHGSLQDLGQNYDISETVTTLGECSAFFNVPRSCAGLGYHGSQLDLVVGSKNLVAPRS